jgi:hypothetical protein
MSQIKCPNCGKLFSNALTDLVLNPKVLVVNCGVEGTECPGCGRTISVSEFSRLSLDAFHESVRSAGSHSGSSDGSNTAATVVVLLLIILVVVIFWTAC